MHFRFLDSILIKLPNGQISDKLRFFKMTNQNVLNQKSRVLVSFCIKLINFKKPGFWLEKNQQLQNKALDGLYLVKKITVWFGRFT